GAYPVLFNQSFCFWPTTDTTPTPTCQATGDPRPTDVAAAGSGGDYLSNESFYRANRLRLGLRATRVKGGHLHVPVLGLPSNATDLTDPAFESRRRDIVAQTGELVAAAGATPAVSESRS